MSDVQLKEATGTEGQHYYKPGGRALYESNMKVFRKIQSVVKEKAKAIAAQNGIKNFEGILGNWHENPDFSIKKFREGAYKAIARRSTEAQAELQWGQLLRAGVMNTFNDLFQATEVVYPALVRETGSNKRQEFYAPTERIGFPKKVPTAGPFPESNFLGLDIELVNQKTGMIFSFERELMDDDMTGQIVQRASQLGENARIYEEYYVMARLFNFAFSFDGETLTASQTYSGSNGTFPCFSTTGIYGTGKGINQVANGRFSQQKMQDAWILSKKMVDQSGRPISVTPKVLAISPQDIFLAKVILESAYNPSMSSTATADIGKAGGIGSINPVQNLTSVVSSRAIPDYMALLLEPKGFNFQRRDPTEVVQENPQSGPAFSQEVFRYKERARWEADYISPVFGILINANQSTS